MGNQSQPDARVRKDLGLPERYEALRHVASGGMASVWCARDRALGRNVAIKLLAERFADDEDANERFLREARAAARLSGHPNVVMIYDVGETDADGRAFIVMEFLAGGTVADALRVDSVRRVHAVKWVQEAASALDFAHSRGVLHRDIKPANLLLDRARTLHVADFGIARLGTEDTITGTGQVLGTASYLAPERALGRPATHASDRYSLAVAAFELLVGRAAVHRPAFRRTGAPARRGGASGRERAQPHAARVGRRGPGSGHGQAPGTSGGRPRRISPRRSRLRSPRRRPSPTTESPPRPRRATPRGVAIGRCAPTDRRAPSGAARPLARRRGPRRTRRLPTRRPGAVAGGSRRWPRWSPEPPRRWRSPARSEAVDTSAQRSASVQRQASAATHKRPPAARKPAAAEAADDSDRHRHRRPPRRRLPRRPRRSRRAGTS